MQKHELHRLEDLERTKVGSRTFLRFETAAKSGSHRYYGLLQKRELHHELERLHKVEEIERSNMHANQALLHAQSHSRALSGARDHERLALLEAERNARLVDSHGSSFGSLSPAMSIATPRIRAVSSHGAMLGAGYGLGVGHPGMAGIAGMNQSTAMALQQRDREARMFAAAGATPRVRAISNVGHHAIPDSALALEKIRLAERKAALLNREAALQISKENALRQRASALELSAQDRQIRARERELDDRSRLLARDNALSRAEQVIRERERQEGYDAELEQRLRKLSMTVSVISETPRSTCSSLVQLQPSGVISSPSMSLHGRSGHSPMLSDSLALPYTHARSRSVGNPSPFLSGGALGSDLLGEDAMLAEAAALGIGSASHGSSYMRIFPTDYNVGLGDGDNNHHSSGSLGDYARSRRGSQASVRGGLGGYGSIDELSASGVNDFGGYAAGRARRESLPFDEAELFNTSRY